ncbi:MAG: NUDIX domain-containing protein [Chloroflexota bacterium]|nr:MAG: NUDIX domain-containing protein [Chloroflexota bacterium]
MQSSQQHTAQGVSMAAKILNVDEAKLVRAAGGVVRRNGSRGAMRIAVVHRPGYDDWSFPKGKVDRGETLEETALRERFRAGSEIDEVRWVTIDDALDLLSYRRDRALLRALDLEATG